MSEQSKKSALRSKTMWTNLILGIVGLVAAFLPGAADVVDEKLLLTLFPIVNIILRYVSKDELYLIE